MNPSILHGSATTLQHGDAGFKLRLVWTVHCWGLHHPLSHLQELLASVIGHHPLSHLARTLGQCDPCHLQITHLEAFAAPHSSLLGFRHWCGVCMISGAPRTVSSKGNTQIQSWLHTNLGIVSAGSSPGSYLEKWRNAYLVEAPLGPTWDDPYF